LEELGLANVHTGEFTVKTSRILKEEATLQNGTRLKCTAAGNSLSTPPNMEGHLKELKENGIALIDEKPRIGIEGGKIAFIHPKSTKNVLIELVEPLKQSL
jgi:hypothetical protein